MIFVAAAATPDADDLLSELLTIRETLASKAVTLLLQARKTPDAYPLALECLVICSLTAEDAARKLNLSRSSLESMLRLESTDPDLQDDFVDAVLTLLVEATPYKRRGDTALCI